MGARRYGPDTNRFPQEDFYSDALGDLALGSDPLSNNRYALSAGQLRSRYSPPDLKWRFPNGF